jgi:hypothetical protein
MRGLIATLLMGGLVAVFFGAVNPKQRRRMMSGFRNLNWLGGQNRMIRSIAGMAGSKQGLNLFRRMTAR